MKIVIPLVGTFGKSGGFRVLSQLANHWINDGHDVVFLSYINADDPYFPTTAKILYYDNRGVLKDKKDKLHPKARLGMFSIRNALRKALNDTIADIVLANHCFTALPVKKSTINARKFYYVQAYEPEYYYNKSTKDYIYKRISQNSYKLGLEIIVNAPMYQNYKEIKTTKVVFPGLDLNVFKPLKKNIFKKELTILGTIGRLEAYKGTSYVIDAFKELRKKLGNKIELHIAFGDKNLENIEGIKVIYPDGDEELAKYYRSLSMYICAGTVQLQAIHYPVIESMACKTPVITTGYYPANKNNAYIINTHDSFDIEKAVLSNLFNWEAVAIKAEKSLEEVNQFDWNIISAKMINFFKK